MVILSAISILNYEIDLKNDAPFLTYLISYEVTVAATAYILALYYNIQAFIQASLPTAVFSQRFSFFTVYIYEHSKSGLKSDSRPDMAPELTTEKAFFLIIALIKQEV